MACDTDKCFECDPLTGECKSRCENGTVCCGGRCMDVTCSGTDTCTSFNFATVLGTAAAVGIDKFKKGVVFLSLEHKYPMPEEWKQA